MKSKKLFSMVAVTLSCAFLAACGLANKTSGPSTAISADKNGASTTVTLKLSHQFPKAERDSGDFRGQLAVRFAEEVKKRTNGTVKVEIYPSSALVKPKEQWDAMQQGALDMSIFPLDYASGKVPEFDISLMPGLVHNHEQAKAWQAAEIGREMEKISEDNNIKILTWVWNAGGIGSKGEPIVKPGDIKKGMKMRAAGKRVEAMIQMADGGITSMPSSEIYSAFQTGILDAAVTSASSFASYKLHEQIKSYVSPSQNTFWFMFEPLVISTRSFDKLSPEQQTAVVEAGKSLQSFAYEASKADDTTVDKLFAEAGVKVVQMDDASFAEWRQLSERVWEQFAKDVEGGKELIELAQKVK